MVTMISLHAGKNTLIISSHEWSRVIVESTTGQIVLGADCKEKILERLRKVLATTKIDSTVGNIKGMAVKWVTSLAEGHCSFYAGDAPDGRHIIIQNNAGETIVDFCLTIEKREEWLSILTNVVP